MTQQNTLPNPFTNQELEALLQPQLGADLVVDSYTSLHATQPGENYGSTMLSLEITIRQTETEAPKKLYAMAKLAPPTEFLQDVFNMPVTFCKEINIYKLVSPEFQKLQRENGIPDNEMLNVFPDYYGARTSLAGNEDPVADNHAALLLENLKVSGYKLADRLAGLDLSHCELAVSKLARFHAMPIALRQKKPHIYEKTVLKAAVQFKMGTINVPPQKFTDEFLDSLVQNVPECKPYMTKIMQRSLENSVSSNICSKKEPFATIVHNDFWTNNMMFHYDENSVPSDLKFVDFQVTLLCSPVKDLIFFLHSSAEESVLDKHYDHLIQYYYNTFISELRRLQCDISAFSFEKFQKEIDSFAPTQFFHIMFMMKVIYTDKNSAADLSSIDGNDQLIEGFGDLFRRKLLKHIQEFDRRGWL